MRAYNFKTELEALHNRIRGEHNLEGHKYMHPNHVTIRPLVILLEQALAEIKDQKERRAMRLALLSLWTEKRVETTYDITVYQCSTILNFFEYDYEAKTTGRNAKRFLADSQKYVENNGDPRERMAKFVPLTEAPF